MRPEKLVLEAFGPFAERQEIDFRELGERGFFLIHGPTGAGKTSILDAMCFALFGETSGNERTARQARSDHAEATATTRVALDFALGAARYRVEREPEHERAKKRGSGTTRHPARATLWRLGDAGEPGADPPLASGVAAVGERIERLLQFGADQFRQVVVLPQGQFRRLLTAPSKDREEILATLFGTALYKRIEEALREARLALERERDALTTARDTMLAGAEVAALADLERARDDHTRELAELEASRPAIRAAAERAQSDREAGEKIAEKLAELEQAERERAALEERSPAVEARRRELERARRAAGLDHARAARAKRRSEAAEAEARAAAARQTLAATEATSIVASAALEAERAREPERDAARAARARLRELRDARAPRFASARDQHAAAAAAAQKAQADARTAAKRLEDATARRDETAQRLADARARAASREAHAAACASLRTHLARLEELAAARAEHDAGVAAHAARSAGVARVADARDAAQAALASMRSARSAASAAVLAQALVAGEPCPVCGSTAHPRPAAGGDAAPTDAALDRQEKAAAAREREWIAAQRAEGDARSAAAAAAARVAQLETDLDAAGGLPEADARGALERAQGELAAADQAAQRAAELAAREPELDRELDEARRTSERASAAAQAAELAARGAQAELDTAAAEIPEPLREPGALDAEIERVESLLEQLQRALDAAAKSADAAQQALAGAQTALRAAEEGAASARARDRDEAASLLEALGAAGFRDQADLDAAARLPEEIDALERSVVEHDRALAAARDREKRARAAAADLESPDVGALRSRETEAKEAADALLKAEERARGRLVAVDDLLARLRANAQALADLDARYAVVGRIAEVAAGDNRLRLPFHRFVLAAQLDLVLDSATQRLRAMSNGRYALARTVEPGSRRGTAGLELEVFDAYTGVARAAATLSGGEGFLASLSLALGLADVVQANAGGIHLESIFVDEGFGSLDPEALDLALRALLDLRSAGRLVGIISHVPELKEQIPTRLEVSAGRSGSRAQFRLA